MHCVGNPSNALLTCRGGSDYWSAAIPVWKESPLIGSGLLTATRFEVLNNLGHGAISTIHGTWIEALVGTGVIGLAFLLASFLVLFARAAKEAMLNDGRIVPLPAPHPDRRAEASPIRLSSRWKGASCS